MSPAREPDHTSELEPKSQVPATSAAATDACPRCSSPDVHTMGWVLKFTIAMCDECGSEWDYVHDEAS